MRCMNVNCDQHDITAENSCMSIKDPSYNSCKIFHTVGINDASIQESLNTMTHKRSVYYLENLKYRLEDPLLKLTCLDTQILSDLIPSITTIARHLRGD
jgi:hypothetical protein